MSSRPSTTGSSPLAVIPASRARAVTRGLLWLAPAFLLGVVLRVIVHELWMSEPGMRSWIVELSLWMALLPLPLVTLSLLFAGLRWLLLGLWPGPVGFFGYEDRLEARLGSFGTRVYDLPRLRVRYFFELDDEVEDGGFEAYLPEEEQIEKYLPRMDHPRSAQPIHQIIMRYAAGSEDRLASQLRPATERWRSLKTPSTQKE